jgi:hypothetical protein
MKDSLECYKALGLEPGCSAESIRNAYLQLSRFYDPDRYVSEPEHLDHAKQKRDEVEVAYQSLRRFLPELQGPPGEHEKTIPTLRDFKEMVVESRVETSRLVLGIIVGVVFLFIFAWAAYLLFKGQHSAPAPLPLPVE